MLQYQVVGLEMVSRGRVPCIPCRSEWHEGHFPVPDDGAEQKAGGEPLWGALRRSGTTGWMAAKCPELARRPVDRAYPDGGAKPGRRFRDALTREITVISALPDGDAARDISPDRSRSPDGRLPFPDGADISAATPTYAFQGRDYGD